MVIRNTVDWILLWIAAFRSQSSGWQDLLKSSNSIGLLFVRPFIYRHLFQTLATPRLRRV